MNNVSLQLQQYRALKAQATSESAVVVDTDGLARHPEKTDYFRHLMQRWEANYMPNRVAHDVNETV